VVDRLLARKNSAKRTPTEFPLTQYWPDLRSAAVGQRQLRRRGRPGTDLDHGFVEALITYTLDGATSPLHVVPTAFRSEQVRIAPARHDAGNAIVAAPATASSIA